jgi:chromosomal replication initiator protein
MGERLTVAQIQAAVCQEFDVSLEEMKSVRRTSRITLARAVAMDLTRRIRRDKLKVVAWQFGKLDHTTIIAATNKVNGLVATDPVFALRVNSLEARLRSPELVEHY